MGSATWQGPDGFRGVMADPVEAIHDGHAWLGDFCDGSFDASPCPDGLSLGGSRYESARFTHIRGVLSLGAVEATALYRHCTFEDVQVRRLTFGNARFESCRFLGLDVRDADARSADLIDCEFDGQIRRATLSVAPRRSLRVPAGPLLWRDNSFRACRLGDVEFRGGVALCPEHFHESNRPHVIQGARLVLAVLATQALKPGTREIVARLQARLLEFDQLDWMVPAPLVKKWGADYAALQAAIAALRSS